MQDSVTLLPAYGRKYDSKEKALSDWNAGKDFKIYGGPYTSIRDIDILKKKYATVWIDNIDTLIRVA